MRVLAEIGVGGVDGQRCVTLVELVSHTDMAVVASSTILLLLRAPLDCQV